MKNAVCFFLSLIIITQIFQTTSETVDYTITDSSFDLESYLDWSDDEQPTEILNGVVPMTQDVIDAHKVSILNDSRLSAYSTNYSASGLPSNLDLSTSTLFPPIRSQGNVGSCGAWAAVYYQYTYEVSKLYNLSSQIESNQYSPNWPYYASINDDTNEAGLSANEIYKFLEEYGALKWTEDIYSKTFQSSMPWPTNTAAMREALTTRLSTWNAIVVESRGTTITSNQDDDLTEIKLALNYGKLLKVSVRWNYESNINDLNKEKTIFYRFGSLGERHAVTIVGYDDNVTYDINNDGVIEEGERGAFKVANSYGPSFGDNGFFWIMYDAMNEVSSVSGDWDDQSTRVPAFEDGDSFGILGDNVLTYIYVEKKEPLFLAEIDLVQHDVDKWRIELLNNEYGLYDVGAEYVVYGDQDYVTTQNRTIIVDYEDSLISTDPTTPMYWGVRLRYNFGSYLYDIVSSIKLTDNKGNIINYMGSSLDAVDAFSCNVALQHGDLNYDGILTSDDVTLIMQTINGYTTISNVQKCLADYDQNGTVNLSDATAVMQAIG